MKVIWQSELSGNRSYPAMGVIRKSELSGYGSYPAILSAEMKETS